MLLPTELVSTASLTTAKTGHVLLALDRDRALIWILEVDGLRFAVFLTGDYAGRGFEISSETAGSGVALGPAEIRVDPNSAVNDGGPWRLRAQDGTLSVRFEAEMHGTIPARLWAPVASIDTELGAVVYFSAWGVGLEADLEWEEVLSVADGTISTSLQ